MARGIFAWLVTVGMVLPIYGQNRGSSGGSNTGSSGFNSGGFNSGGFNSGAGSNSFGNSSSSGFRQNNSTFGSGLSVNRGTAGANSDPFSAARADAAQQGRAGANTGTLNTGLGQFGQTGQFGTNSQFGQTNRNQNRQGRNSSRQNGLGQGIGLNQLPVRSIVRIGLSAEEIAPPSRSNNANVTTGGTTINLTANRIPGARTINARLTADGVAVLTGEVTNARAATLASAVVSLEPGVRSVRNELEIVPEAR